MRFLYMLLFIAIGPVSFAQQPGDAIMQKDSLLIIEKKASKGFHSGYILYVPKGTLLNKQTFLLVEPNNTGLLSDSIEVHTKAAINLATVSSVGHSIATGLKIPLLVPVFPRPASQPLLYTHALDRDVMTENDPVYKRLDLQLLEMIADAKNMLLSMNIRVDSKFFMNGFSASATFTNRFSFIHPDKIKALAIGGFNGKLMLPQERLNDAALNYPIGINDFETLFRHPFDLTAYRTIPQFIYMGKLDDNDAVQYDDAYTMEERKIINTNIGQQVQERYLKCQEIYQQHTISPLFKTYDNTGHWTNREINGAVTKFFSQQMREK
jgi:hypothetical protein